MPVKKGKLKPCDYDKIQRNFKYMSENIDGADIVDDLFDEKVFTADDVEEVKALSRRDDRTKRMLYMLLQSGPQEAYDKFLKIMREAYPEVADKLEEQSSPDDSETSSPWAWFDELPEERRVEKLSDRVASRISSNLGEGWEYVFLELGLSKVAISHERARNPRSEGLVITGLLIQWRQKVASAATLQALVQVLKRSTCEIDMDGLKTAIEDTS